MSVIIQPAAKDFWIVKRTVGRKYLGVIRLKDGRYWPWFEAKQIGEPQGSLEDAAKALDV